MTWLRKKRARKDTITEHDWRTAGLSQVKRREDFEKKYSDAKPLMKKFNERIEAQMKEMQTECGRVGQASRVVPDRAQNTQNPKHGETPRAKGEKGKQDNAEEYEPFNFLQHLSRNVENESP